MAYTSKEKRALIASFIVNFIFGLSFMFSKKAITIVSVFTFLSYRFTFAFLFLSVILLFKKAKINYRDKPIKKLVLLGFVQPVCYFICENYGISMSTTSFAGIIIAIVPVTTIFAGMIFLKEIPTKKQVLFSVLSILGVAVTTFGEGNGAFSFAGMLLLLGAVISASVFNILSRECSSDFSAFERTYMMTLVGCVLFSLAAIIQNRNDLYNSMIVPLGIRAIQTSILYLSLLSSVCAFMLLNYASTYLPVAKTSIFANVVTAVTVFAGIFLLNEAFTAFQLIGCIIIVISIYFVNKS